VQSAHATDRRKKNARFKRARARQTPRAETEGALMRKTNVIFQSSILARFGGAITAIVSVFPLRSMTP